MFTPRTLLFPTDGSACAERARGYAVALAERFGADLHVLRVEIAGPAEIGFDALALTETDLAADLRLPRPEPAPSRRHTLDVKRKAIEAGPAILAYAAEVNADLVVMGTHGRRGLRRLVLGSTAEYVLRRAASPVLLVSSDEAAAFGAGRILVPDDFSAPADRAFAVAHEIAREAGVGLDVLHVIEEVTVSSPYGALVAPPAEYASMTARAKEALRGRKKRASAEAPTRVFVTLGDPVDEVLAHARQAGIGLIVMGSHGLTGFDRVLLGSVAEGVVRRAHCPVLVVKVGAREAGAPAAQETIGVGTPTPV